MPTCTMPYIPWFRKWYNEKFKDLCEEHDDAYKRQDNKEVADLLFTSQIVLRGYPTLAILSYYFLKTFGIINYYQAGKKRDKT